MATHAQSYQEYRSDGIISRDTSYKVLKHTQKIKVIHARWDPLAPQRRTQAHRAEFPNVRTNYAVNSHHYM